LKRCSPSESFSPAASGATRIKAGNLSRAEEIVIAQQMIDARQGLVEGLVALPEGLEKIRAIYAGITNDDLEFDHYLYLRGDRGEGDDRLTRTDLTGNLARCILRFQNEMKGDAKDARQEIVSHIMDSLRLKDEILCNLADGLAAQLKTERRSAPEFSDKVMLIGKSQKKLLRAKNILFMGQETLPLRMARQYLRPGMELDDLEQEGRLGLMRGIEGYEPRYGVRLYTYVCRWVGRSLTDYMLRQSGDIYLPLNAKKESIKLAQAKRKFQQSQGRMPNLSELATLMETSVEHIRKIELRDIRLVSLDKPLEDGITKIGDVIGDESLRDIADVLIEAQDYAGLKLAIAACPARSADILSGRFGLGDDEPQTLEVLSRKYGVSRERIRQLEVKTLQKVRENSMLFGLTSPDSSPHP
jgi:RNA polymerase sigma factor (sigma-70 family)